MIIQAGTRVPVGLFPVDTVTPMAVTAFTVLGAGFGPRVWNTESRATSASMRVSNSGWSSNVVAERSSLPSGAWC